MEKKITYEECKKRIAEKNGYKNLVMGHLVKHFDEAAELYTELRLLEELEKIKWEYEERKEVEAHKGWIEIGGIDLCISILESRINEITQNKE
jgi:hypothetical protein